MLYIDTEFCITKVTLKVCLLFMKIFDDMQSIRNVFKRLEIELFMRLFKDFMSLNFILTIFDKKGIPRSLS